MIVELKNKPIFKNRMPLEIKNSVSKQKKIEETWENFIQGKKNYFNGEIYTVTNIEKLSDQYILEIGKTRFADLVYAKQTGGLTIYSLFASIIFKTKDSYYLMIKNNHNTINAIGGLASATDFENEVFVPEKCLEREIKEEIGLSLKEKAAISNYEEKYLKIPANQEKMYPCGIIFTGTLNYTKSEFETYFNNHREKFDNEIKKLLFYTKETYLKLNNIENKVDYLIEVIDALENKETIQ